MTKKFTLHEHIRIAYKKLKANAYFDKTKLSLCDKIVEFEVENVEEKLEEINRMLSGKREKWTNYEADILNAIGVLILPKKLCDVSKEQERPIIFNMNNEPVKLKQAQYFIDLPIIGQILSVLWVMSVGLILDNRSNLTSMNMYEHSYGNRLRKTLINQETQEITYSPNLFEPYFSQYESWRDRALRYAKKRLDDKQDAIILTLDFKSFFYSVDIEEKEYKKLLDNITSMSEYDEEIRRIHDFVYKVLQKYSAVLREMNTDEELQLGERTILPIGFLPSNILSNWALTPFDDAIIKRWNPVYYGRYVDDIIIVDKVEKNSPLHKWALGRCKEDTKLTTKHVIEYYFRCCATDRILPTSCKEKRELFKEVPDDEKTKSQKTKIIYRINPDILSSEKADIQVQNDKVKVFYFHKGSTRALLDCFRTQIAQNASEFRYLPDMDNVLNKTDYSEIFHLSREDSIHKLHGVTGVSLDKFALSKFLGKYRKVGGMIRDKRETEFDKDILTILDKHMLIEYYTLWERLLEIMIVNDQLNNYEKLVMNIFDAIIQFDISEDKVKGKSPFMPKEALLQTLYSAICRTAALRWGASIEKVMRKIGEIAGKKLNEKIIDVKFIEKCSYEVLRKRRKAYCSTRMVNKYVMPLLLDCIEQTEFDQATQEMCLCKLEDVIGHISPEWTKSDYKYYPYMVTPQELSFALACQNIGDRVDLSEPSAQRKNIERMYCEWNYPNLMGEKIGEDEESFVLKKIKVKKFKKQIGDEGCFAISVDDDSRSKLKVSIGNALLDFNDFQKALTEKANRGYERYKQLAELLHAAVKEQVDLLVLPESYLPWEWVPNIARLCANNQIALITGIEHIVSPIGNEEDEHRHKSKPIVYNLTAVILPYRQEEYKYVYVTYHQKVHYSPEEKRQITGYRFIPAEGKNYHFFQWKGVWFSVYCCFELTSIQGRALFQSFADLTVAVEWNKDVAYFSNIVESLCRDLHCFCIQANSSDYGDSRVMSPSRTEKRDLVKTKGGRNSIILVDEINIAALREFQRKEYELQRQDDQFKPTPPNFDPDIVVHKQKGTLWKYMEKNLFEKTEDAKENPIHKLN